MMLPGIQGYPPSVLLYGDAVVWRHGRQRTRGVVVGILPVQIELETGERVYPRRESLTVVARWAP